MPSERLSVPHPARNLSNNPKNQERRTIIDVPQFNSYRGGKTPSSLPKYAAPFPTTGATRILPLIFIFQASDPQRQVEGVERLIVASEQQERAGGDHAALDGSRRIEGPQGPRRSRHP